jgi:amino acid transporter
MVNGCWRFGRWWDFSVLGVIIGMAGQLASLSFILAGIIALISAISYSQLSIKYKKVAAHLLF